MAMRGPLRARPLLVTHTHVLRQHFRLCANMVPALIRGGGTPRSSGAWGVTASPSNAPERRDRSSRRSAIQQLLVSRGVLCIAAFAVVAAQAHATGASQPQPPPLSTQRYIEDYAYLRNPAART